MRFLACLILPLLITTTGAAQSFAEAQSLFEQKRDGEARAAFSQLAVREPRDARHPYHLGMLATRGGDPEAAVQHLERAVALDSGNAGYHLQLGGAYGAAAGKASAMAQLGLARKARRSLERAVELDPASVEARMGLMMFYRHAPGVVGGGIGKARAQAEAIRRIDPRRGAMAMIQLQVAERQFEEAFATADAFRSAEPDAFLPHFTYGRIAAISGQRIEAGERALRRSLELSPGAGEPSHASAHWRLGNLAEKRGDIPAARAAYEASLQVDPQFRRAIEALAKLP